MGKRRIAVATFGNDGLKDVVSNFFSRARTFTITDIENGMIENVIVMGNSLASYNLGAWPMVVQMLVDKGVDVVLANKLGPWAAEQLT